MAPSKLGPDAAREEARAGAAASLVGAEGGLADWAAPMAVREIARRRIDPEKAG
jgi:hypothetical protein